MSESEQSGAGRREVAYRLFAAEFDDADFSYSESDEERAPNYVITPTGARVNRLFVVGVLTEVEAVSEDVLRARVVDPTGAFVLYAGQYQPDEQAFLDGARTPMFVAVTGKARTFQPDDSDQVFTSVRPESISEVDAGTRDRWTVQTAEQTIERVGHMATALSLDVRGDDLRATLEDNGVDEGLAAGIPLAIDHYGTTGAYLSALRETALDAARLVADELDEVDQLTLAPGDGGDADLHALADADVEVSTTAADVSDAAAASAEPDATAETETATSATSSEADATDTASTGSEPTADAGTSDESVTASDESPVADETTTPDEGSTAEASDVAESGESDGTEAVADRIESTAESSTETVGGEEPTDASETVADAGGDSESETTDTEPVEAATATTGSAESPVTETEPVESTSEGSAEPADAAGEDEDIGDFEPGEFELDEDEREEIEEEFGTEFQSGTDVPEPGESDIDTPDPEELAEAEPAAEEPEETTGTGDVTTETTTTEPVESEVADAEPVAADESETADDEPADTEDVDLEDATVEVMGELDDGDGADRETLVETVAERYGASPDDVEAAIQDALMGGRCYEPDDTTVKPI